MPDSTLKKRDPEPDMQTSKSCPHTSMYRLCVCMLYVCMGSSMYGCSGIKEMGCLSRGRTDTLRKNMLGFEE